MHTRFLEILDEEIKRRFYREDDYEPIAIHENGALRNLKALFLEELKKHEIPCRTCGALILCLPEPPPSISPSIVFCDETCATIARARDGGDWIDARDFKGEAP